MLKIWKTKFLGKNNIHQCFIIGEQGDKGPIIVEDSKSSVRSSVTPASKELIGVLVRLFHYITKDENGKIGTSMGINQWLKKSKECILFILINLSLQTKQYFI